MIVKDKPFKIELFDFGEFEVGVQIDQGGTSSVKEITKDKKYAMKALKNFTPNSLKKFMPEMDTLLKLRHLCIVKIVGFNDRNDENPPSIFFLSLQPTNFETAIKESQQYDSQKCCI